MSGEIEARRELDALVAEKVFGARGQWWSLALRDKAPPAEEEGITWRHGCFSAYSFSKGEMAEVLVATPEGDMPIYEWTWPDGSSRNLPRYSTEIGAAWSVVEKMRELGYGVVIGLNGMSASQNGVKFFEGFHGAGHSIFDAEPHPGDYAVDNTVPLAICKAALRCRAALAAVGAQRSASEKSAKEVIGFRE